MLCGQVSQAVDNHFDYILLSNEQEEDSDEEGDDELFDHEDEVDGIEDKLDDIDRVLIVEGQQYSGDIDFYLYLRHFT